MVLFLSFKVQENLKFCKHVHALTQNDIKEKTTHWVVNMCYANHNISAERDKCVVIEIIATKYQSYKLLS